MGNVLCLWSRTIRIDIDEASRLALSAQRSPVALVIWHNRLFMEAECIRRYRDAKPFYGLISTSKDGAWLVGFFEMLGIKAIRGSSSWSAREAVTAMIKVAQRGEDIAITPDGPLGPCYEFKPGSLIIARRAHLPMVLLGMEFSHAKQLRSWDKFIIPWPFSRMRLRCALILPEQLPANRHDAVALLTARLNELNGHLPTPESSTHQKAPR